MFTSMLSSIIMNDEYASYRWSSSIFIRESREGDTSTPAASPTDMDAPTMRSSVGFSPRDEKVQSPLQRLQRQVTRALKGFSSSPDAKNCNYNPEILISQKRQWARFHLQSLSERPLKGATRIFESFAVVGLHPTCNVRALREQFFGRKAEASGKFRVQSRVEPNIEPQVLFVYPPEKRLPLKCKDLVSFCFPAGVEVHAIERTPSMSEINEILIGQEHLKRSGRSFIFRLQVADNSTLYGCCLLADELVEKPSRLVSMVTETKPSVPSINRHMLTTRRCYCILSRLPYFELHFGVLNSIFMEERLERLTTSVEKMDLKQGNGHEMEDVSDEEYGIEHEMLDDLLLSRNDAFCTNNEAAADGSPLAVLRRYESCESSSPVSLYDSPVDELNVRSGAEEMDTEEACSSGSLGSLRLHGDMVEWAKANGCGSLRIMCEYYELACPERGSTLVFHPLGYLNPLEFHRPNKTVLHIGGTTIDVNSRSSFLELAEVQSAFLAEEESAALSVWAVSCICCSLRLENMLTFISGVLLEKQVIVVSSNLGILCALVLSMIPLIRPYQWQSLLMPVLPNDMLDFLDAPVPYVVGVKKKTAEVQMKIGNVVLVDANKNQVKSPSLPRLPRHKDLLSSLTPFHAKLAGESNLGRTRPVYECTDVQFEAAKGLVQELRAYLDSLCSNMRTHTITSVQSNDDKVSLLLRDSFIESFSPQDRPFMKLFVDTQLFSVYTDLALSAFQKD